MKTIELNDQEIKLISELLEDNVTNLSEFYKKVRSNLIKKLIEANAS